MQIILMEKVVNLGGLGDVVKVKDGYARNFLIPHGKAKRATEANLKEFEGRRAELEKKAADLMALMVFSGSAVQVKVDFTNDRDALEAALTKAVTPPDDGFSAEEVDPLREALGRNYLVNKAYERSLAAADQA